MKIDQQTIHKIADLARLELSKAEETALIGEMNKILTFMEKLNELDTTGVEPLVYMNNEENTWREDGPPTAMETGKALQNAPERIDNYFVVPKILEK